MTHTRRPLRLNSRVVEYTNIMVSLTTCTAKLCKRHQRGVSSTHTSRIDSHIRASHERREIQRQVVANTIDLLCIIDASDAHRDIDNDICRVMSRPLRGLATNRSSVGSRTHAR